MKIKNKDVQHKLEKYFMTQDVKLLAIVIASLIMDINRWVKKDDLPPKELESLIRRSKAHVKQLDSFLINGAQGGLQIIVTNSSKDANE